MVPVYDWADVNQAMFQGKRRRKRQEPGFTRIDPEITRLVLESWQRCAEVNAFLADLREEFRRKFCSPQRRDTEAVVLLVEYPVIRIAAENLLKILLFTFRAFEFSTDFLNLRIVFVGSLEQLLEFADLDG